MKKILIIVLLSFLVGSIVVFVLLKSNIVTPEFKSFKNIEFIDIIEDNVATFKAELILNNPNSIGAQLISTNLDIYSKEVKIGTVYLVNVVDIKAKSDFSIPLKFNVYLNKIIEEQGLSGLLEKALNSERSIDLNFRGISRIKVDDKLFKVPISYSEEITIK